MENTDWYLAVKKRNQGLGLKSIELLILSQIEEFQNNGLDCYITNEQFSYMFGESTSTVKRSLDRLEKFNIVKRRTVSSREDGKGKKRTLALIDRNQWKLPTKVQNDPWSEEILVDTKVHNDPWSDNNDDTTKVHNDPWYTDQGSNIDLPRFKSASTKVHNDTIKYKEKKNKKINNGHYFPSKTAPSASSETLPAVAPAEKKNSSQRPAQRLSDICGCSVGEMEGIVNDNGLDYHALLRCVENGYIDGKNLYSKTYWDSMDVDDVLRDPTYEEYLVGMYMSNPNGLNEAGSKQGYDYVDDLLGSDNGSVATENIEDAVSVDADDIASTDADDMSWLDDISSWTDD